MKFSWWLVLLVLELGVVWVMVATHAPELVVTPPAGYHCKPPVLFAQKGDSAFFQVDCGR